MAAVIETPECRPCWLPRHSRFRCFRHNHCQPGGLRGRSTFGICTKGRCRPTSNGENDRTHGARAFTALSSCLSRALVGTIASKWLWPRSSYSAILVVGNNVAFVEEIKKIGKLQKGRDFSVHFPRKVPSGVDLDNLRLVVFEQPDQGKVHRAAMRRPES